MNTHRSPDMRRGHSRIVDMCAGSIDRQCVEPGDTSTQQIWEAILSFGQPYPVSGKRLEPGRRRDIVSALLPTTGAGPPDIFEPGWTSCIQTILNPNAELGATSTA